LLRVDRTGEVHTLSGRSLIGRAPGCAVVLDEGQVSSEHATIAWRDGWWVRDLASRNGTTLRGEPVHPGVDRPLARGVQLAFASVCCTLIEDGPPRPAARDLQTGALCSSPGEVLALPEDHPTVSIVPGPRGGWQLEREDDDRPVSDREEIEVSGRRYRLYLPVSVDPTLAAQRVTLSFLVSPDEEHVSVELIGAARRATLRPRIHLYLLLTLARARLSATSPDPLERGWVLRDDLARMLRCDPVTINVQLHRLRQDLAAHGLEGAPALLEVRARTGQVRLGTDAIEIQRGDRCG
jgi:hypothetical protein